MNAFYDSLETRDPAEREAALFRAWLVSHLNETPAVDKSSVGRQP